jgi:general secretion pathway protein G
MIQTNPRNRAAGVTLLEMMIVLAIIALIVGLGAPRLMETFGRAKSQAAEVEMATLKGAIQLYYIDTGQYPTASQTIAALITAPPGIVGWRGPYLDDDTDLLDPWGRPYIYAAPGNNTTFQITTLGRDGQPGGTGEDSDISL